MVLDLALAGAMDALQGNFVLSVLRGMGAKLWIEGASMIRSVLLDTQVG